MDEISIIWITYYINITGINITINRWTNTRTYQCLKVFGLCSYSYNIVLYVSNTTLWWLDIILYFTMIINDNI